MILVKRSRNNIRTEVFGKLFSGSQTVTYQISRPDCRSSPVMSSFPTGGPTLKSQELLRFLRVELFSRLIQGPQKYEQHRLINVPPNLQ